jgi:enoyl-CoA hydratase/carnithine racemase
VSDDGAPVLLTRDGAITTITLNRPTKMNALDLDAWVALSAAVAEVKDDDTTRALIVRGAGGNFCAGADVRARGQRVLHPLHRMQIITDTVRDLFALPVPTIAAVDGVAVGAGWNIALACDFVVATERSRFSQIFARRGLSVDTGGSWLLPRLVSMQVAKRLLYLAEMLNAPEVHALGLLAEICATEALDEVVDALTTKLVAAAPVAIELDKQLLAASFSSTFAEQLDRENQAQLINFATDAPAARAAIANSETPIFEGKWQL